jgi:DNA-binding transcriptional LysR family regulator
MLTADDLTWFQEIMSTGNMSRAAERLGVSQPTLSHWLRRLEARLGQAIFRRSRRGTEPTPYGERLSTHAAELRRGWDEFLQAMEADEQELRARFRFGIHASVALFALPPVLKRLRALAPAVRLILQHGPSRHICEDLISKRLDAGIVVNPIPHSELVIKELYRDRVRAFALPGKRPRPFLIVHPGLAQTHELRKRLTGLPESVLETDSLEVAAHLALAGEGVALLPERVAHALAGEKLRPVGEARVIDHHCLVYRPTLRETPTGRVLLQAVREAEYPG